MKRCIATLVALLLGTLYAFAQQWPSKTVRIIVPFAAGATPDVVARLIADGLQKETGQAFIVENKPGASGNTGTDAVAKAAPDGATIGISIGGPLAINTLLFAHLPYDFARDTTPIGPINRIPLVLEASPSFAPKSVAELIAAAKAKPGAISMGSPSAGTPPYLCVDLLNMMADIQTVHVPYFGENQMVTDLLGAQVMIGFGGISAGIAHVKAGKLRALAVTTPARLPQLPEVPTVGETVPGFAASGWNGIVGPKNTPRNVVERIAGAVKAIQADAMFKQRLTDLGVTELAMPPAEFGTFIVAETAKWAKVVKFAGLTPH